MAVPVLMHHHVSPAPGLVTISPARFRSQIGWLARAGYRSLTADEYADYLAGRPVAPRSVLITFDDGWLDNWMFAHPILAEHGMRAVLFLVTGRVGDGPPRREASVLDHRESKAAIESGCNDAAMLRWAEVEAMMTAGTFEVRSHTHSHTRWDKKLPPGPARNAALGEDLDASREALTRRVGDPGPHLCWPQGYYDTDYLEVAAKAGFTHCYTVEPRTMTPGDDPRRIGRYVVKDKGAAWIASRVNIWRRPRLAELYARLRGQQ